MTEAHSNPEHVDVLIVGSGPAGSTYARVVGDARPDVSILVVEAGPRLRGSLGEHTSNMSPVDRRISQRLAQGPDAGVDRPPPHLALSATDRPAGTAPFIFPGLFPVGGGAAMPCEFGLPAAAMSTGVGGMGVHWSASTPRPSGSERNPFIPSAELDSLYDQAEILLGVSKDLRDGDEMLAMLRDLVAAEFDSDAAGAPPVGYMPLAIAREDNELRVSGTSVILGDLADRVPGFSVRPDTLARYVLIEGDTAVGALLEDRMTDSAYEVRAERVVVCADSLRTPQLLFASGVRPTALGHYLNDHLQMMALVKLDPANVRRWPSPESISIVGSVLIPFVDGIRPMQGQLIPLSRTGAGFHLLPESMAGADAEQIAILAWYGAKDIQVGDAVEFDESRADAYGMPAMIIHYNLTDADRRTIELMSANVARCAKVVGSLITEPALAPGGSSLHYQGTVRMGPKDDGTCVCDTYGRVWSRTHLYVGGNGVIPTSTAANPTLTTVALAARAAARLAADLSA